MSRRHATAAAVAALVALASACSGTTPRTTTEAESKPHASRLAKGLDPYTASLSFARCMRRHGVPHPNPDRKGDFSLTPHQEELMRKVGRRKHEAAERACFHYLKPVVSTKPLSPHAMAQARQALRQHARCMAGHGYDFFSGPVVKNLSLGRAMFGFQTTAPGFGAAHTRPRYLRAQRACEKILNRKLNRIIAADRKLPPAA